jgi:hypothetical protein
VHSIVKTPGVEHELQSPDESHVAAVSGWIVDSQLGTMSHQPQNLLIAGNRVAVVDEYADTHAAIGSLQQVLGQHAPGLVASKNVILKVKSSLRGVDDLRAGPESIRADIDDTKRRLAGVLMRSA